MIITIDQFKQIVAAGGSLVLDSTLYTLTQLKEIVIASAGQPVTITLKNIGNLTHEHINLLAVLAPGKIAFDFS